MLKKRLISVTVAAVLMAEMIIGSATAYGIGFPIPQKGIGTSSIPSAVNLMQDDIKKKIMSELDKIKTAQPTSLQKKEEAKRSIGIPKFGNIVNRNPKKAS